MRKIGDGRVKPYLSWQNNWITDSGTLQWCEELCWMMEHTLVEVNGIPLIINRALLNLASKVRIEVAPIAGVRLNPKNSTSAYKNVFI
jgi:hypothetical protein